MINTEKEFYKLEEISQIMQLETQTIIKYIKKGELKAIKLGKGYRVEKEALQKWIESRKTQII